MRRLAGCEIVTFLLLLQCRACGHQQRGWYNGAVGKCESCSGWASVPVDCEEARQADREIKARDDAMRTPYDCEDGE